MSIKSDVHTKKFNIGTILAKNVATNILKKTIRASK